MPPRRSQLIARVHRAWSVFREGVLFFIVSCENKPQLITTCSIPLSRKRLRAALILFFLRRARWFNLLPVKVSRDSADLYVSWVRCGDASFPNPLDPPSTNIPHKTSGQQVNEHDNSATLEDCRASCCADPACGVYLYTSDSTVAPHLPTGNFSAHCWLGHEASTPCRNTPHGWVGGRRTVTIADPGNRRVCSPATLPCCHVDLLRTAL